MKYVLSLLLSACIFFSASAKSNERNENIDVNHYVINLNEFNIDEKSIVASTTITLTALNDIDVIELELRSLNVTSVASEEINVKDFLQIEDILTENNVKNIYYYDINNDKAQDNKNYYDIKKLLKGSLVTTDDNQSNLLAPSFYIIEKGKVLYYNIETAAMKNTDKPADYWNEENKTNFKTEITEAINKYYLNNTK